MSPVVEIVVLSRLPWVAVWIFERVSADDLGVALVPLPLELGDEIAVSGTRGRSRWSTWCGNR